MQNLLARNRGDSLGANAIKRLTLDAVDELLPEPHLALAVKSNVVVMQTLDEQIKALETVIKVHARPRPDFQSLLTVSGIGDILGLTILLETGPISRFPQVGDYASYCRCVGSEKLSNGKRKGRGNTKNGNRYLARAFVEAAHFAVRYDPHIKRYYQRKLSRSQGIVAIKTVAHKLARACYYVLRDRVPFDVHKAFA